MLKKKTKKNQRVSLMVGSNIGFNVLTDVHGARNRYRNEDMTNKGQLMTLPVSELS